MQPQAQVNFTYQTAYGTAIAHKVSEPLQAADAAMTSKALSPVLLAEVAWLCSKPARARGADAYCLIQTNKL